MIIELQNKEIWDKTILESNEIVSPFILFESIKVWQNLYQYQPFFLACEENSKIKSVMPILLDIKRHILVSLPFKHLGGATNSKDYDEYLQYIDSLSKKEKVKMIYLSFLPFADYDNLKKIFSSKGYNVSYGSYYLVNNIENKKYEEIKKEFSRNAQRNIKKGKQKGIVVKIETPNEKNVKIFYQIYLETMRKNNAKNIFSLELFSSFAKNMQPYLQLRQALLNNTIIASSLDMVLGKQIITWFIVFSKEFREYSPASMIYNDLIEYAIKNNLSYANFGPSGWNNSNFYFKKQFGVTTMPALRAIKGTNFYEQAKIDLVVFIKNFVNYRPKFKNFIRKFCKA